MPPESRPKKVSPEEDRSGGRGTGEERTDPPRRSPPGPVVGPVVDPEAALASMRPSLFGRDRRHHPGLEVGRRLGPQRRIGDERQERVQIGPLLRIELVGGALAGEVADPSLVIGHGSPPVAHYVQEVRTVR